MTSPATVDDYIARFPASVQAILQRVRATALQAVPEAEEAIRYGMPTLRLGCATIIHFAAFKNHIGLYPPPACAGGLARRLAQYRAGKGSLRFPLDRRIPYSLIREVVRLRRRAALARAQARRPRRQPRRG